MRYSILSWVYFCIGIGLCVPLCGQEVIGQLEWEDFDVEEGIYPFHYLEVDANRPYLEHEPALRLDAGDFLYLWRPDRGGSRKRILSRYNLLLEEDWSTEFEIGWQEEILYLLKKDSLALILSYEYLPSGNFHKARFRRFSLHSGELITDKILFQMQARASRELIADLSPDSSRFVFYYFDREKHHQSASLYWDHVEADGSAGFRVYRADFLRFKTFNLDMDTVMSGSIPIEYPKISLFDCQIGNQGNIYLMGMEKPTTVRAWCYREDSREWSMLEYHEFPDFKELTQPYTTHFPPKIGQNNRLYLAYSERILRGKQRGTKAYQILNFDFDKGEVDLNRRVEINSTIVVRAQKSRTHFGLRPMKRFDAFMIHDVVEMPNQSTWLITQKYDYNQSHNAEYRVEVTEHSLYELILYEFDPKGNIKQAIIIPTVQKSSSPLEQASGFYAMNLDKEQNELAILTWESSGYDLRGPERLFYRKVNLETAEITKRKQIYEGRRRYQYFLEPYTVWHNNDLVSFVMVDGEHGDPYMISVNLEGEKKEEEKRNRRKRHGG